MRIFSRNQTTRIFLLRRKTAVLALCLLGAAAIFTAVSLPYAAVSASATERQLPIYCVDSSEKRCAISFDAAWGNEDTQQLIDILARYNIKTTFFVVGDWAEKYPESVKALHEAGHEVMSHSAHHDHYNSLTANEIIADCRKANETIAAVTGITPTLI
ncbi:MAG: polysaccharide deacetylase family protein, partial [Oscillospiraceae bacterium]|nr:polysaccharide deacetylase family protein [Oscillospiraceae bacterium]